MKKTDKKGRKRYNRSFARRLTRWVMLVVFIMMSALGYFIYVLSKSIVVEVTANTFHTNMQASAMFFSNAMSDVSEAVINHVHDVEQHLGQPAPLQDIMTRIVELNPRVKSCDITYVKDSVEADWFREVVATDSACWSKPFFESHDEKAPVVAYLHPLHDR